MLHHGYFKWLSAVLKWEKDGVNLRSFSYFKNYRALKNLTGLGRLIKTCEFSEALRIIESL